MTGVFKYTKKAIWIAALLCSSSLWAQKQTEIYIPVGQSPGVSGNFSTMGEIMAVDTQDSTVTIASGASDKTIKININADCEIYLDKSKLKQTNIIGSWADIKPGLLAEVKYKDNEQDGRAEWIKIQLHPR